jgi:4-aminobutyrate aminotransferase-like enzyme
VYENTKHQTPNTKQAPNPKYRADEPRSTARILVFGAWCLFGVWCLVFGVCLLGTAALKTKTQSTLSLLRAYESRNVTFLDPDESWPIVWERARGVHVWDAEGKKYLDLTAAFGVAAAGHANRHVVRAGQQQMAKLLHAMGDVHPHALKAQLSRELSRITFEKWSKVQSPRSKARARLSGKTIFCNSGFEAVEAALKTAMLATGKRGVIAFEGAYHGLGYGALNATHREHFRASFRKQLGGFTHFAPFPQCDRCACNMLAADNRGTVCGQLPSLERHLRRLFQTKTIGAILVEPIQVRGGINTTYFDFLPMLRRVCNEFGAVLIFDEIFTGFGRTGRWFACEWSDIIPDIICLGKALTGGFPLSACVGRANVMDLAWPQSTGEAIHTSTFLGHPVGCAMALAQIEELRSTALVERCVGEFWLVIPAMLADVTRELPEEMFAFRGNCLLAGLELRLANGKPATEVVLKIIKRMLHRGFILLPEGEHSNVISFTPPLTITKAQLWRTIRALGEELHLLLP